MNVLSQGERENARKERWRQTRNEHENHFDLPLLIFKALYSNVYSWMSFDAFTHISSVCFFFGPEGKNFFFFLFFRLYERHIITKYLFRYARLTFTTNPELRTKNFSFACLSTVAGAKLSGRDYLHTHFATSVSFFVAFYTKNRHLGRVESSIT